MRKKSSVLEQLRLMHAAQRITAQLTPVKAYYLTGKSTDSSHLLSLTETHMSNHQNAEFKTRPASITRPAILSSAAAAQPVRGPHTRQNSNSWSGGRLREVKQKAEKTWICTTFLGQTLPPCLPWKYLPGRGPTHTFQSFINLYLHSGM